MIPAAFEYKCPESLDEALALLEKHGDEAKVLTGGHSLIPALKLRLAAPTVVVDLRRVSALAGISEDGEGVRIGALVTHHEVEESELVRSRCLLVAQAAAQIGDVQVRNMGTLCGSVCHADPAADYPAALLALDAEVMIASPRGEKSVKIDDFLQGILTTSLETNEIVEAIRIPQPAPPTASYLKVLQSASGFAIVGVAAQLWLKNGGVERAAIGVTGVADRAFRAIESEKALRGKAPDDSSVAAAVKDIAGKRELLSDMHASAEYRRHLVEVYARRAVLAAAGR